MKIVFTPESIEDLSRLRDFIETKNPHVAKRIANSIIDSISQLKKFPYIGVEVSSAPDPEIMRDLIFGNYIIRYLVLDKTINILSMWHHKEDE